MVRDGTSFLLTMRVQDFAAQEILILRSPPQAGVSKDGHREVRVVRFSKGSCGVVIAVQSDGEDQHLV
jgi:hypothetical protein